MAARKKAPEAPKVHHSGPSALLSDRFAQAIVMLDPAKGSFVESVLQHVAELAAEHPELLVQKIDDDYWDFDDDSYEASLKPYEVDQGVLSIPVTGVLLNNFDYQIGGYATGYQYIEAAYDRGMEDPNVKAIALVVNSPGGQASGNFELVDHMVDSQTKPVDTFVNGLACSGGYSIATVGDSVSATKSSVVGSIGVVMSHVDLSGALEKQGVKVTLIYAGEHKVDGNPYEPLPKAVKDRLQKGVDLTYGIFCSTVAKNRAMDEADVRATEADTFTAQEGVDNGLVDKVATFKSAMTAYRADQNGASVMANVSQEDHDKAVKIAADSAKIEGGTAAKSAERARIQSIMSCDEAKEKQKLASHLAYNSDMSLEQVKGMLTVAASEVVASGDAQAKANQEAFDKKVGETAPNVGAAKTDKDDVSAVKDVPKSIIADYVAAGGAGVKESYFKQ